MGLLMLGTLHFMYNLEFLLSLLYFGVLGFLSSAEMKGLLYSSAVFFSPHMLDLCVWRWMPCA